MRFNMDTMTLSPFEVVTELAKALDSDDYDTARKCLAEDCHYDTGREIISGADAIIDSYRDSSEWGNEILDELIFKSEVQETSGDSVTVMYIDLMFKNHLTHRHECRQVCTVGSDGKVVSIVHHDLPGENESLFKFFKKCGIER